MSAEDSEALERLSGAREAPTLSIGSQILRGYAAETWAAYLDAAGYPRESRLPSTYQYPAPRRWWNAARRHRCGPNRASRAASRRPRSQRRPPAASVSRPPAPPGPRGQAPRNRRPALAGATRLGPTPRPRAAGDRHPHHPEQRRRRRASHRRGRIQRHHCAGEVDRHRAQGDRLAVPLVRRDLVQRRHDHRLHRAQREAEHDGADAHDPGLARTGRPRRQPAISMAPISTRASRSRCASNGITTRTAVTAIAKTPSTGPIVDALKPRSWPSIGTTKLCTSQLDDSSQLTSSRRRSPARCSRSQERRRALRRGAAGGTRPARGAPSTRLASGSSDQQREGGAKAGEVDQRAGEHRPDHVGRAPARRRAS